MVSNTSTTALRQHSQEPWENHLNGKDKMATAAMGMCKSVSGNGEQWPVVSTKAPP